MTIFCTRDKKDVIDILLEKLSIFSVFPHGGFIYRSLEFESLIRAPHKLSPAFYPSAWVCFWQWHALIEWNRSLAIMCYMRVYIMIFNNNLKFVDIIKNKAENNFAELNIVHFKTSWNSFHVFLLVDVYILHRCRWMFFQNNNYNDMCVQYLIYECEHTAARYN